MFYIDLAIFARTESGDEEYPYISDIKINGPIMNSKLEEVIDAIHENILQEKF